MVDKRKVLVTGIKKVGPFTNRETGEIIEGYNVFYYDDKANNNDGEVGILTSKKWLKPEDSHMISGIGYYNMLLEIDISGARPRLNITGFEFLKSAQLVVKEN